MKLLESLGIGSSSKWASPRPVFKAIDGKWHAVCGSTSINTGLASGAGQHRRSDLDKSWLEDAQREEDAKLVQKKW